MTLIIKNANKNIAKIIKDLSKLDSNIKIQTQKEPNKRLLQAIQEAKELKQDFIKGKIKGYKNIDDLFKDLDNDKI